MRSCEPRRPSMLSSAGRTSGGSGRTRNWRARPRGSSLGAMLTALCLTIVLLRVGTRRRNPAAGAVVGGDLQAVHQAVERTAVLARPGHGLKPAGARLHFFGRKDVHADRRVRARQRQIATLRADGLVQIGISWAMLRFSTAWCGRKVPSIGMARPAAGRPCRRASSRSRAARSRAPRGGPPGGASTPRRRGGRARHFAQRRQRRVDRGEVARQHRFAALAVGLAIASLILRSPRRAAGCPRSRRSTPASPC